MSYVVTNDLRKGENTNMKHPGQEPHSILVKSVGVFFWGGAGENSRL